MKTLLAFAAGALLAAAFQSDAKTYDEKKWEALAKHREVRRANERRYEACYKQCIGEVR